MSIQKKAEAALTRLAELEANSGSINSVEAFCKRAAVDEQTADYLTKFARSWDTYLDVSTEELVKLALQRFMKNRKTDSILNGIKSAAADDETIAASALALLGNQKVDNPDSAALAAALEKRAGGLWRGAKSMFSPVSKRMSGMGGKIKNWWSGLGRSGAAGAADDVAGAAGAADDVAGAAGAAGSNKYPIQVYRPPGVRVTGAAGAADDVAGAAGNTAAGATRGYSPTATFLGGGLTLGGLGWGVPAAWRTFGPPAWRQAGQEQAMQQLMPYLMQSNEHNPHALMSLLLQQMKNGEIDPALAEHVSQAIRYQQNPWMRGDPYA